MHITTVMTVNVNIVLFDESIEQQYLSDALQNPDNSDHSSENIQQHLRTRLENQRILIRAILEATQLKHRFLQALFTRHTQAVQGEGILLLFLRHAVCALGMQDQFFPRDESGLLFEDEVELILDENMIRIYLAV